MTSKPPSDPFADRPANRRGRPVGSRAKLGRKFFEDFYAAWEEQGPSVIARAFFHDPVASLSIAARLMPQKIEVTTPTDGISDEKLVEMIEYAEQMAGLRAKVVQGEVKAALPVPAHKLTDENGAALSAAQTGGEGRYGEEGGGGVNTSSAQRPNRPETGKDATNALNATPETGKDATNALNATSAPAGEAHPPRVANSPLPYPVGKPRPTAEIEKEVDPDDLF